MRRPYKVLRKWVIALAITGGFFLFPAQSHAQFNLGGIGGGINLGGIGGGINLGGIGGGINLGGIGGNLGSNLGSNAGQSPYLMRSQNQIPNPVNFWQYSQVTGVKPTFGTVTIYNTFGQQGMTQNPFQQAGIGGGGAGGIGGGAGGNGMTQGGDDPPQGVLLHVNYANMFLPNQQQINQQNALNPGAGGLGGIGGGLGGGIGALGGIGGGIGGLGGKFGGFNGDYGL